MSSTTAIDEFNTLLDQIRASAGWDVTISGNGATRITPPEDSGVDAITTRVRANREWLEGLKDRLSKAGWSPHAAGTTIIRDQVSATKAGKAPARTVKPRPAKPAKPVRDSNNMAPQAPYDPPVMISIPPPADDSPSWVVDRSVLGGWVMALCRVGPELATEWLKANKDNRPMSVINSGEHAATMSRGHWMRTHQGIAFDEDGHLIDGQHRLKGVVLSGVTIEIHVTWCEPREVFKVVDSGKVRNAATVIANDVHGGNPMMVASCLRLLNTIQEVLPDNPTAWKRPPKLTGMQIFELLLDHPDLEACIRKAWQLKPVGFVPTGATVGYYLALQTWPGGQPYLDAFVQQLVTGKRLPDGDPPAAAVRNHFMRARASGGRTKRVGVALEHACMFLHAWNKACNNEDMLLWRFLYNMRDKDGRTISAPHVPQIYTPGDPYGAAPMSVRLGICGVDDPTPAPDGDSYSFDKTPTTRDTGGQDQLPIPLDPFQVAADG